MYIVVIVIGIISIVVGANMDPATSTTSRELFIGLGAGIVLVGIYAWIRGIGPIEPELGPGFRFDFWPDGVVILALLGASVGLSFLIF